jgi:RNA polymerase sigma-70 factor (ECF subfamily)
VEDLPAPGPRAFATTQWSLVVAAMSDDAARSVAQTRARAALEQLCRAYWYPLYAFVRHRGYASEEAQDLTQSFFVRVIEKRDLAAADPERGRFRSYLLGAMKHFLANEWHRAQAQKRGGGATPLDLDVVDAEVRYARRPAEATDADAYFDREWAQETTARALERLQAEMTARGNGELFQALRGSLAGQEPPRSETAARLGMTEGAVKVAVHRLRQRYRERLRAEIAETIDDPAGVDAEMRHLVQALRAGGGSNL